MWIYMAHKSTIDKALKAHYKQQILNYNIAYKIKLNQHKENIRKSKQTI